MGLRFTAAQAISAVLTWGLRHVFRRPAGNFPGKMALYVDPDLISHAASRLRKGSVVVVGTNGKTTTTNLLADVMEASGKSVVCNREGANLASGVATALLHSKGADWGVFESDELWLAKTLPHLQADYVVLLNLFRDQLDRCGEIDRIQDSIAGALKSSPCTVLVYNADDPLCARIAAQVDNKTIAFGVAEDMHLPQNSVADAQMCQRCSGMFEYAFRQYGQLGDYRCPQCGFSRPPLDYAVVDVRVAASGVSFALEGPRAAASDAAFAPASGAKAVESVSAGAAAHGLASVPTPLSKTAPAQQTENSRRHSVHSSLGSAYMVYNLAAVAVAADLLGCDDAALQQAVDAFDPQNGRLQSYVLQGRRTLLNLAKNPTGFNQNLKIIEEDESPKAVAFFINDREADGHDISWLWDIDFEELAAQEAVVFAGGRRREDMRVRLKYAGIKAQLVESAADVFANLAQATLPDGRPLPVQASVYLIANYTALPPVHADLGRMEAAEGERGASQPVDSMARTAASLYANDREGVSVSDSVQVGSSAPVSFEPHTAPAAPAASSLDAAAVSAASAPSAANLAPAPATPPLVIAHLFPDLLNLYGDGGNVRVLEQRCRWRDIPVEVKRVRHGDAVDLADVDLAFMGGGPDREQRLASEELMRMKDDLRFFVESDGVLLAICGGYQILGSTWLLGDEAVEGLGLVDIETRRAGTSADRLIGDIVLHSPLASLPVVGYENHAGRTYLGAGVEPFGQVAPSAGRGNNDEGKHDGVRFRNAVGTYLHGPLLSKNPEVADALLERALQRWARRTGNAPLDLAPLDDAEEKAANAFMCARLNVR